MKIPTTGAERAVARTAIAMTIAMTTSACAGSRANVTFDGAKSPISLSASLYDETGAVIDSDHYKVVNSFLTEHKRSWAIFYSGLRFQKELDFSAEVNDAIATAKGEGIVNLKVMTKSCGMNTVIPLIILPFWPGCVRVWVSGDVMSREGVVPSGAAPEEQPAGTGI